MNPKVADDGSVTISMQPTSPCRTWRQTGFPVLPPSPTPTPADAPLLAAEAALDGTWFPPPAVEVM
jgi:hypothetical protein